MPWCPSKFEDFELYFYAYISATGWDTAPRIFGQKARQDANSGPLRASPGIRVRRCILPTSTTASWASIAAYVGLCVGPSYRALKICLCHLFQLLVITTRLGYAPFRDGHGLAKDKAAAAVKFDITVRPTMFMFMAEVLYETYLFDF